MADFRKVLESNKYKGVTASPQVTGMMKDKVINRTTNEQGYAVYSLRNR
jgi:hypothetical protein